MATSREVGRRLADVQRDGHRALDGIFESLSVVIFTMLMRIAIPDDRGVRRLTRPMIPIGMNEINRALSAAQPRTTAAILATTADARAVAQIDVDPLPPRDILDRVDDEFRIAESLTRNRPSVIAQAGMLLARGVATGLAASAIARTVKQYFFLRDPASGLIQLWPGRANMASQHARTVMLSEATYLHGLTMKEIAERNGLYLRWNVSSAHRRADYCDSRRGIYPPGNAPPMPAHPNCRCYYSTVRVEDGRVLA